MIRSRRMPAAFLSMCLSVFVWQGDPVLAADPVGAAESAGAADTASRPQGLERGAGLQRGGAQAPASPLRADTGLPVEQAIEAYGRLIASSEAGGSGGRLQQALRDMPLPAGFFTEPPGGRVDAAILLERLTIEYMGYRATELMARTAGGAFRQTYLAFNQRLQGWRPMEGASFERALSGLSAFRSGQSATAGAGCPDDGRTRWPRPAACTGARADPGLTPIGVLTIIRDGAVGQQTVFTAADLLDLSTQVPGRVPLAGPLSLALEGRTPAAIAAELAQRDLDRLLIRGDLAGLPAAIKDRRVANQARSDGWTPLMLATAARRHPAMRALLELGAEADAAGLPRGSPVPRTPLLIAIEGGDAAAVDLLLAHRASADPPRLDFDAQPQRMPAPGEPAPVRRAPPASAPFPLEAAIEGRHAHLVERLLRAGARPDRSEADGITPLMMTVRQVGWADREAVAGRLIAAGADPARRRAAYRDGNQDCESAAELLARLDPNPPAGLKALLEVPPERRQGCWTPAAKPRA